MKRITNPLVFLLIVGAFCALFTLTVTDDADAWARHACCVEYSTYEILGVKITYCSKKEVTWHWKVWRHSWCC